MKSKRYAIITTERIIRLFSYTLQHRGQNVAFSGNVINVVQDITDLVTQLPRLPADLPVFKVRRKYNREGIDQYKDFQIRRERVLRWLRFLVKWSKAYSNVTIVESNLANLPANGTVASELRELSRPLPDNPPIDGADVLLNNDTGANGVDDDNRSDAGSEEDGGVEGGPMEEVSAAERDDVLETGFSMVPPHAPQNEAQVICDTISRRQPGNQQRRLVDENEYAFLWPQRGAVPIDEYNTAFILAR
jgi:hypothetical protein